MEKYRIANRQEEAQCCQCGYPLYIGDTAYEHGLHIFCSKTCKFNYEYELASKQGEKYLKTGNKKVFGM